jgi:hypothetical protein
MLGRGGGGINVIKSSIENIQTEYEKGEFWSKIKLEK